MILQLFAYLLQAVFFVFGVFLEGFFEPLLVFRCHFSELGMLWLVLELFGPLEKISPIYHSQRVLN